MSQVAKFVVFCQELIATVILDASQTEIGLCTVLEVAGAPGNSPVWTIAPSDLHNLTANLLPKNLMAFMTLSAHSAQCLKTSFT